MKKCVIIKYLISEPNQRVYEHKSKLKSYMNNEVSYIRVNIVSSSWPLGTMASKGEFSWNNLLYPKHN